MPTNVVQFNAALQAQQKYLLDELFPIFLQKVGLELLTRLVLKTRVRTGRARGNWQASINAPRVGEIPRLDPSGSNTITTGAQDIAGAKAGNVLYFANNVPYIEVLDRLDNILDEAVNEVNQMFPD